MKEPIIVTHIETYLAQAEQYLSASINAITQVSFSQQSTSLEDFLHMKLILQYRLSLENSLKILLQLDSVVCEILGISSQHSAKINLERLMFMVGTEELQHMLTMISQLLDSLERIVQKLQYDKQEKRLKDQKKQLNLITEKLVASANRESISNLKIAIEKQDMAAYNLTYALEHIEQFTGELKPGPIYDHISALAGPISRFFQAIQNGLGLSGSLYEQATKHEKLNLYINSLLNQTNLLLTPRTLFNPVAEKNLEERASAKRLGHFFQFTT